MQREEFVEHGFSGCLHKPFTVAELLAELSQEALAGGVPQAPPVSTSQGYNFAALTAFSADDAEASRTILESFVAETRRNAGRLRQAADEGDVSEMAAVSHKMIPLFIMLEASGLVALLRRLEGASGQPLSEDLFETASEALKQIEDVLEAAPL